MQRSVSCVEAAQTPKPHIRVPVRCSALPKQRRVSSKRHPARTLQSGRVHAASATSEATKETQPSNMKSSSSSQARCPFGGSSTASVPQQDIPADSASADGGSLAGLSVSFPPRDYLAFKDEAYRIDLRLDRISLDDIFEIDEVYEADMARKAHILATRPTEMLLPGVPGSELAKREVLNLVVKVLTGSFPDRFQLKGSLLTNASSGEEFDISDEARNPMDVVARLLQEDVAVMQKIDGKLVFSCGAVVSPLGWSGSAKLGLDLSGIHKPVPQFNDGPALTFVTKIFERGLSEKVPLTRANWFIMHTPELSLFADPQYIPESPDLGPVTIQNAGDRLFLRCERQVATRLPECGGVMFTFRTYLRPLKVLEERTEVMQRLLAAFLALPDEVIAYRHAWHDMSTRQVAIAYLEKVAKKQQAS